jgi:hypothetical protein
MNSRDVNQEAGLAGTLFWRRPQLTRRLFFRHLASAVGGYFLLPARPTETVARAAVSPKGTARFCIFVLMNGGPSHVDTFDLKTGSWTPAFMNPETYNGVAFPQGLMPTLAANLDSMVLLRSVRAWAVVHELGRTWIQIGRNPTSATARIAPHIGSVVSLELASSPKDKVLPGFVSLNINSGPLQGYLAPEHAPFFISPSGNGLPNTRNPEGQAVFERRYSLLQQLDAEIREGELGPSLTEMGSFNQAARRLMYNPDVDRIFTFPAAEKDRYGGTTNGAGTGFGNSCIAARNLIRADAGTRFIQLNIGGWDHHSNIYAPNAGLQSLARQFDLGLGNLIADLKSDGLLDQTFILAMGEFGRTVGNPNSQAGRDHFAQQAVLVAGGGIRGGRAIGATDNDGREVVEPGWSRNRVIRPEDLEATIYSALGIDWTTIRRDDPLGRGFEYVPSSQYDLYGPVHELWG